MTANDDAIIQFIRDRFDENLAVLQLEGGHALAPEVKESARNQVLLYWRKLRDVAERITDTEVKLSLPGQRTPQGREFTIEGVVDIVREDDRVVMYDVKTHDADAIEADKGSYERQLNVYAHIWQNLRGQQLDETAIICTAQPFRVGGCRCVSDGICERHSHKFLCLEVVLDGRPVTTVQGKSMRREIAEAPVPATCSIEVDVHVGDQVPSYE